MAPEEIRRLIRTVLPDAEVYCKDLTGTEDHWQITVISETFQGQRLLKQHRAVKDSLHAQFQDHSLHALSLKTYTPTQWKEHSS